MGLLTIKLVTDIRDHDYEAIEFHGELDQSTLPDAERQVNDFLKINPRQNLLFDLANLKFINSEGIGFIVSTHARMAKRNQKLLLCCLQPQVADVFRVIGLPKLIPVFATTAEAIAHMKTI